MTVPEKLSALRNLMSERGIAAYAVMSADFHGSEYVGAYFMTRSYMSGFTGSAGTLLVTADSAYLWTDGRYFLQAASQLEGTGIELMKIGEKDVPTIQEFLADKLPDGSVFGFDGRTVGRSFIDNLEKKLKEKHKTLTYHVNEDLIDPIWKDRPPMSQKPVWELDVSYTGLSAGEKLSKVREKLDGGVLILTALDEIAWLLNLRGDDVMHTPVFLSYMLVFPDKAILCVDRNKLSQNIIDKLSALNVEISDYDSIYSLIESLPDDITVSLDPETANYRITDRVKKTAKLQKRQSPVIPLKAVKTPEEIENFRTAHIKDGVAVTRFMYWLKHSVGNEEITELSAADKLHSFRAAMDGFLDDSFGSIVGYAEHGAIVHYGATEKTNIPVKPRGLLLVDSGGHYMEGSTDITRTFAVGELSDEEIRAFTLVLKGNLNLGAAVFKEGCGGENLDILARMPLWENGLDYNHGTGHGVGYLLDIHEGPQSIHWKTGNWKKDGSDLKPGMITSNEPGLYITGKFGVRHENLVLCKEKEENEYGRFLCFETLTMVPFDKEAIDATLLTSRELELLNSYHETVYENLSPYFEGEELQWLRNVTSPMVK